MHPPKATSLESRARRLRQIAFMVLVRLPPAESQTLSPAVALEDQSLWMSGSSYTHHFKHSSNHHSVRSVGFEWSDSGAGIAGLTLFTNSFGQPSAYWYPWGAELDGRGPWQDGFVKWSAGLLYGYRAPYNKKVPFNYQGFSPGAIVAAGYRLTPRFSTQVNLLGDSGLMLQFNVRLD